MNQLPGERLYQAILNKVTEEHGDFDEAAVACGFEPDELLDCFGGNPNERLLDLYDHLGREQLEKTAEFLGCPPLRVMLMADIFSTPDIEKIAGVLDHANKAAHRGPQFYVAEYIDALRGSSISGDATTIMEELIASTFSEDLAEACEKTLLPLDDLQRWSEGVPASFEDLHVLRQIASSIGIGLTPVLMALGVLRAEDFIWKGEAVDPLEEMKIALNVSFW